MTATRKIIKNKRTKVTTSKHDNKIDHKNIKTKMPAKKSIKKSEKNSNKNVNKKSATQNTVNKKVVIVHGWDGDINKGWFPWLKKNLESQGFKVVMEQMPNADQPTIEIWTNKLKDLSGDIDDQTYFIGHSIGCQTIIRMLEQHEAQKTGGVIFLAGWFDLKEQAYKENSKSEKQSREIAKPWINTNIDFSKIQPKLIPGKITAIFSEDDPYVDLNNAEIFKQKLGARILVENGKKHYSEEEIDILPILVEELLRITKSN